ncbi:MAG: bifunctional demethylmenaquinone methyltransferase/2-methoxy-6-polyprenyl-1,4-benzoquinol methylase UbiE [Desulfobacterota bacterium]|nr:bifunctional demethylmenaquinone methyltransferase/2-methoxy-6-polyprenyl-1,4-benzoquinol methylase UbiE [Thermodesulfobacteriota bacterium]
MSTVSRTPEPIKQYFDRIAPHYDRINTLLSFGLHHVWRRRTITAAEIFRGARVLDVCSGTGDLAVRAGRTAGSSGMIVAYDFSRTMLVHALKKQNRPGKVHLVCGDAERIALRDESFDVVLIGFGLRNLLNMDRGIAEIYRVLRHGGRCVCLEFSRPKNLWFRLLYDVYSFYVIPWLGGAVSGCREAYQYLPASIRRFPLPDRIVAMMQQAGFVNAIWRPVAYGIAALYRGEKL